MQGVDLKLRPCAYKVHCLSKKRKQFGDHLRIELGFTATFEQDDFGLRVESRKVFDQRHDLSSHILRERGLIGAGRKRVCRVHVEN
jgi:hypothetical protein